ncbi:MAG: hypothetical protein ACHQC9_06400 [Alphaproteobacteria bacterium]
MALLKFVAREHNEGMYNKRVRSAFVTLADRLSPQQSGDMVLGQSCLSLAEVEKVVEQIRLDLDAILTEAKATFSA